MNAPVGPAPLHLLDLPTELLLEALRDAPWCVRATCRRLRDLVDGERQALCLCPRPDAGPRRQVQHLANLLRQLPSLRSLHVDSFEFSTLPFLAACPTLEALTFSNAPRLCSAALPSLRACPRLTTLQLVGYQSRQLTSIHVLSALTALRSLNLEGCIKLTSVAPLRHCPHITSLALGDGVTSLGPITTLHALASLACGNLATHDLSPISSAAASLTRLRCARPSAAGLSLLLECTQLVSLEVNAAWNVRSFDPLTMFGGSLICLHLWSSPVVDLHPISACTSLSDLALVHCAAVTSLAALTSLRHSLTSLNLWFALVTDASPLSSLTALRYLDLRSTAFTSAALLTPCTLLRTLRVAQCRIPADELHALAQAIPLLVMDPV